MSPPRTGRRPCRPPVRPRGSRARRCPDRRARRGRRRGGRAPGAGVGEMVLEADERLGRVGGLRVDAGAERPRPIELELARGRPAEDDAVDALVRSAPGERDRVVARGRARATPRSRSPRRAPLSRFVTPRALNEPVCWRSSALSDRPGASAVPSSSGVRRTRPRIVSAARTTSSRVGGSALMVAILDRRWALHAPPPRCRARSPTPAPRMRRWTLPRRTPSGSSSRTTWRAPADGGPSARARAPPSPLGDPLRRGGVRVGLRRVARGAVLGPRAGHAPPRTRRVRPLHGAPVGVPHARRLPLPELHGRPALSDRSRDRRPRAAAEAWRRRPPRPRRARLRPGLDPRRLGRARRLVRHRDRPRRRRPRHGGRPPRLVRLAGRGAMPRGMRDVAAYGIGYGAQVTAYAYLLTDRYPDAAPGRLLPGAQPRPPRGAHRLRRPGPAAPHRRLPSTSRAAAPVLADALGGPGRARGGRGVGRRARRRPRPARAPPLPGRVRPDNDARVRVPLRRREALPGLRRRRGHVPDRPHGRRARSPATSGRARPRGARVAGASPLLGMGRRAARRRRARLGRGTRDGPDADGPPGRRRRCAPLPGAGPRVPAAHDGRYPDSSPALVDSASAEPETGPEAAW